jgi:large subunit ribosomal protein L6
MLNLITKTIDNFKIENLFLLKMKNKKLMVLTIKNHPKKYFTIPHDIYISFENNKLTFKIIDNKNKNIEIILENFYSRVKTFIKNIEYSYKKILKIKGLGLKVTFSSNLKFLIFKLGFSHLIYVSILDELKISLNQKKKYIVIESIDILKMNKFIDKIRQLRAPNIYKGKGIFLKNYKEVLKPIKKK